MGREREKAADRKEREAQEFNEAQIAHYTIVGRLRPTAMKVRYEDDADVPAPGGAVEKGELLVFELDLAGYGVLDVETPWAFTVPLAAQMWNLHKKVAAEKGEGEKDSASKLITAAGENDVKAAAAAAAAAERLRGE